MVPRYKTSLAWLPVVVIAGRRTAAPDQPTREAIAQFESATSLDLPPTAQVVGVEHQEGRDRWKAKVVLDEKAFASFLETLPVDEDAMTPGTGGFSGIDERWWDPYAAQGLHTGQVRRESGAFLNVGIDDTDPKAVLVYIRQF